MINIIQEKILVTKINDSKYALLTDCEKGFFDKKN
jgi:hypothetical protein